MLLSKIPGYQAAVARAAAQEETLRRRAFLPHTSAICGVPVRPFTPRHFLILDEAASPFLTAQPPGPEHVAQFLWIVSPRFVLPSPRKTLAAVRQTRAAFVQSIARLPYERAIREIDAYVDAALIDRPSGGASGQRPVASFAALIVDDLAAAYGWPDEVLDRAGQPVPGGGLLDMPLARLCQYRRLIWRREALRLGIDFPLLNRLSDGARDAVVNRFLARQQKAGSN